MTTTFKHLRCFAIIAVLAILSMSLAAADSSVSGTLKKWDAVTISFQGPRADALDDDPNPFLDYRLQVHFTSPSGREYSVPGWIPEAGPWHSCPGIGSGPSVEYRYRLVAVGIH